MSLKALVSEMVAELFRELILVASKSFAKYTGSCPPMVTYEGPRLEVMVPEVDGELEMTRKLSLKKEKELKPCTKKTTIAANTRRDTTETMEIQLFW